MKKTVSLLLLISFFLSLFSFDLFAARKFQQTQYSLAVIPFAVKGRLPSSASKQLAERLQRELVKFGSFQPMNITKVESVLRENNILPANCSSEECGREAGKLVGAALVVNGKIRKIGSLYQIEARILHGKTGEVVRAVTDEFEGSLNDLAIYMRVIAAKLTDQTHRLRQEMPVQDPGFTETTESDNDVLQEANETLKDLNQQRARKRKKGGKSKWIVYGLLGASVVGAGVFIMQANSQGENGEGVTAQLPGPPVFPDSGESTNR